MNKQHFIFLAALLIAVSIFGQSPEKISYQAVVRDATNATVANQVVGMKISILQDGTLENPGSVAYSETQTPTTNANGLLSIYIGAGTAITGIFSGIAWSNVPHYIKIEIDPSGDNTNYTITGTTQLVSVPFALYAKTAENTFSGDYTDLTNQPDNTTAISDETARALAAEQANEIVITTIQTEQTTQNVSISLNSTKISIPTGGTEGQVLKMVGGIPVWTDPVQFETYYKDADGDGYGNNDEQRVVLSGSNAPNGYVDNDIDCNDTDAAINPNTVWYIGVDTDNDTYIGSLTQVIQCESPGAGYVITELTTPDCDDTDAEINPNTVWYIGVDADNDTYIGSLTQVIQCEAPGVDYALIAQTIKDCKDDDASINPTTVWYADIDGDGFGDINTSETGCSSTLTNATQDYTDCDDTDASVNPATVWYADVDNDGFGDINTSETGCSSTLTNATQDHTDCDDTDASIKRTIVWYADIDGDGFGDINTSETGCSSTLTNATQDHTDCDDTDASIKRTIVWYADIDGDGFGDINTSETGCSSTLTNATQDYTDCDDTDASVNPATVWYADVDNDGFGDATSSETRCSAKLANATQDNTDCDDKDASINPTTVWYVGVDSDGDSYIGNLISVTQCNSPGSEYSNTQPIITDCNDTDEDINPGKPELPYDDIDNDCNPATLDDEINIGYLVQGGIVFWVDPADNNKGLVCAIKDQSAGIRWNITWFSIPLYPITGATGTAIGTGRTNTAAIIAAQDAYDGIAYAAELAKAFSGGGFNDWFLPSLDELIEIYQHKTTINTKAIANGGENFVDDPYWSSTEIDNALALTQNFTDGYPLSLSGKSDSHRVRAVRAYDLIPAVVGDLRAGGVVFWVDPTDNMHGLVCAIEDQAEAIIWCNKLCNRDTLVYTATGATGYDIGTGSANTTKIITKEGAVATDYAAGLARAYRGAGYTDWFLPSKDELNQMYLNKTIINNIAIANGGSNFRTTYYWSSTELADYSALSQNFSNGLQYNTNKTDTVYVRAVRAF
jgi:hypothetical protein